MKKGLFLVMLAMSSLFAELNWASSYEEALQEAKEQNKIVMLMFSAPTCKMCAYMKNVVYEDAKVMEYIEGFFIPVEVDITEYPEKFGYQVFGTPTYYFLRPNSTQIGRMFMGGAEVDGFIKKLKEVREEE